MIKKKADVSDVKVFTHAIPDELKRLDQWVVWSYGSQFRKLPRQPNGRPAKSNDPSTWCSFEEAVDACKDGWVGVGFMFSKDDPYFGVDLDACINPETGTPTDWAQELLNDFGSYAEVSPSGLGIKITAIGRVPAGAKSGRTFRPPNIDIQAAEGVIGTPEIALWNERRFWTFTGQVIDGHETITNCQAAVDTFFEQHDTNGSERRARIQNRGSERRRRQDVRCDEQRVETCLAAVQRMDLDDHNDGSHRLYCTACRCVEHNLTDEESIELVHQLSDVQPFPRNWTDAEILLRIRDAEEAVERGGGGMKEKASKVAPEDVAHEFLLGFEIDGASSLYSWNGSFWNWDGGCYREMSTDDIRSHVTNHMNSRYEHVTVNTVNNVVHQLKAQRHLQVQDVPAWIGSDQPDWQPEKILATTNSLVNLGNQLTLKATPTYFNTNCLAVDYQSDAATPVTWLTFLGQLWPGDPESIATLQEWCGYLLTANTRLQRMLLLVGPTRSGKSTIARVLRELLGEANVAGPTLASLATNFGLSGLLGKSLAVVADARISGHTDKALVTERLLSISGEDTLSVDRKYKPVISTKFGCRVMMISNELPQLTDSSGAFRNRFIILQTMESFLGREDHELFDRIREELPGILLWAIEGYHRLMERGRFQQPESAQELVDDLMSLSSPISEFVEECCVVGKGHEVSVDELYERYRIWCESVGRSRPVTRQVFGRDLRSHISGIEKKKRTVKNERKLWYVGIGIRSNEPWYDFEIDEFLDLLI